MRRSLTLANRLSSSVLLLPLAAGLVSNLPAQSESKLKGSVERIKVHGKSLEGNLSGDSADRDVSIYLPPSYKADTSRRYPVVYFLHGFTDSDDKWYGFTKHWINLPEILDKAMSGGQAGEMIVVTPNAFTRFQGSMYSSSVTIGDWETFVAEDLVSFIDGKYRTLAKPESRGLAGHSMGGYGTMRIGMKRPDVFSSLYLLSPCCMGPRLGAPQDTERIARVEAVTSVAEIDKADFGTKAMLASAAAWSPNPANPPFFIDLPVKGGELQPMVFAKWTANAPLAMVDSYIHDLRRIKALAMDAGDEDRGIAATVRELDEVLNNYKIDHFFEIYEGNHVNRIGERIDTKALPFFSKNLSFK